MKPFLFQLRITKPFHPLVMCFSVLAASCSTDDATQDGEKEKVEAQAMADGPLDGLVTVDRLPMPDDPVLLKGREVWAGTCQGCHGLGIAGSPKITDRKKWAPRIAKGRDVLHQHALEGFFGDDGAMMPERGGNPGLSDEEVMAAVDFMVANSQ